MEPRLDPKIEELVAACAYEFGTERERVKPVLWVVLRDELMQRVDRMAHLEGLLEGLLEAITGTRVA